MPGDLALVTTVNEAESIGPLVTYLRTYGLDVLVVDAGSLDGTAAQAQAAGAVVMELPRLPIRQSLMAGWEAALRLGYERLVQVDAGGSHLAGDAARVLDALTGLSADLVIGSRFLPGSVYQGRPWRRELSRAASAACRLRSGAHLTDWTSGLRAFTAFTLGRLLVAGPPRAEMHGWQVEVLGQAVALGLVIREMPIHYLAGRSSFRAKTALEAFRAWRSL